MKRKLTAMVMWCLFCCMGAWAQQITVCNTPVSHQAFPLCSQQGIVADMYIDNTDYEVVKIAAKLFSEDVERVIGKKSHIVNSLNSSTKKVVIIGTIGRNKYIDQLIAKGKLDVSSIRGGWEQYLIQTVENPQKGIDQALVIAGSDRRGTAYGVFSLSEAIGVSPLYWWADIPVRRQQALYISPLMYTSHSPSVQYRGIFINDEGWGFTPWAAKTVEPQLGNIGPETYAKVCELILRLKGNMLAPAMHPASTAFNVNPKNKMVADQYAIIMTSSHCEPLLYNNTTEWDKSTSGEWNYLTNKERINTTLHKRVSENAPYENVYVLAMRGIHDAGLVGVSEDQKAAVTEQALTDQRQILSKYIAKPVEEIPQIFVPYKEVLDIYEKGMNLPDDITIVWPDDNFGYIKKLSDEKEQQRKGGSGVYYHISYLGEPHDYLWLNTTPPALMYEEMKKAYDAGANRYWLLNVGDIKPGELGMKFFLDMAWNIHSFSYETAHMYDANFLASIFGEEYKAELLDILSTYYQLGFQRKPEAMGWGFEWNSSRDREQVINTDFSFINYNEAENRMRAYDNIANKSERILNVLPKEYQSAFYELVFYPVKGAALMNKKMLTAQKNRWYAFQGRAATQYYADKTRNYYDSIQIYTQRYNSLLNGKWNHMMALAPGWTATYQQMPPLCTTKIKSGEDMHIFIPGKDTEYGVTNLNVLPCLNPYTCKNSYIELYNKGDKAFLWKAETTDEWILLDKKAGKTLLQERIIVSVDWNKVPLRTNITGEITIASGNNIQKVYIPIFNPQSPTAEELKGMYVEDNGCVSIHAGAFHRKQENKDITIRTIKGLGYENGCVQLGEAAKPVQEIWKLQDTPKAEYDFYTFSAGTVTVYTYALPLFPVNSEKDTRYGIMIDNGMVHWMTTAAKEYSSQWKLNVIRNAAISVVNLNIEKPGKHTLKILCGDPGTIIQKVVIDFGGMKRSYLGPEPTWVK